MRSLSFVPVLFLTILCALSGFADPAQVDTAAVGSLLTTLKAGGSSESPEVLRTNTGFLRFVGAPAGGSFPSGVTAKSATPDVTAKKFLADHAGAFSVKSAALGYNTNRTHQTDGRIYVRLEQTYAGLTVFGSGVTVQLDSANNVACVLSDIMRDPQVLESGGISLRPSITPDQAAEAAVACMIVTYPNDGPFAGTSKPTLVILDPAVVGNAGSVALAWQLNVQNTQGKPVAESVLIDAHESKVLLHYPLVYDALFRTIYDAHGTANPYATLERSEGGPVSSTTDVNQAYDYYGDTYNFYFNENGRDSIDNAGMTLDATVRYCPYYPSLDFCPFPNAFWDGTAKRMYFGEGFTADDVVGHELTHGVTQYESGLIYQNESGAINESLSDVWGEFIDLSNGKGTDTPAVRWLMGEDIPLIGAIRSMKDPTLFDDPDRYNSPYFYVGPWDSGGVHVNSGVNNKLSYLLTDGADFNCFTVQGMGIPKVIDLYYEAQRNLLVPTSDYYDLYAALKQAAINIGLTATQRTNLAKAMCAVEIDPYAKPLRQFRAQSNGTGAGILLTWTAPTCWNPVYRVTRRTDRFAVNQYDGTIVYTGSDTVALDSSASDGTEYFYTLGALSPDGSFCTALHARAKAGDPKPNPFSEEFPNGTDLSFTQFLFSPVFDIEAATNSGDPAGYVNYNDYAVTVTKGVTTLPVSREDAYRMYMPDDGLRQFSPSVAFPFFGNSGSDLYLSANGYIALQAVRSQYSDTNSLDSPSYENHFAIPRISFLFSNLSPRTGGEIWSRSLDEGLVVTFDKVPEYGSTLTNTVQVELFYSGQIKITYLEVSARNAICGLSDGKGIPLDPGNLTQMMSDLSALSNTTKLRLDPLPLMAGKAGSAFAFTLTPRGGPGGPLTFSAQPLPTGAQFNTATGAFSWITTLGTSVDRYSFVVKAQQGGQLASEEAVIDILDPQAVPSAKDLTITPANPTGGQTLQGTYTFVPTHEVFPESLSVINWFKNGSLVPVLANQLTVPGEYVKAGDTWHFSVIPKDNRGNAGARVLSAAVTVGPAVKLNDLNQDGAVNAIDIQIVINAALGVSVAPYDADLNYDGSVNSVDVQTVINSAL